MENDCLHCSKTRKLVIIGCGFVGSTCAFTIMQSGLFSEIVFIDSDIDKADGEATDISHGIPFAYPVKIYAGSYEDITDASILIITAGANQQPNESRLDLAEKNISIFQKIIPEISKRNFDGILLIVSNPVDILTTVTKKLSNLPKNKIIGSGTVLDTARLQYEIGKTMNVDSRNINAFVIGEHGDSEIVAWSVANISGMPLVEFCQNIRLKNCENTMFKIEKDVKNSAYKIIEKKKATYFGIAMATKKICETIIRDEKSVMTVSTFLNGEYGINDIAISIPVILGKDGVERVIEVKLNENEMYDLKKSSDFLKNIINS